MIHLLKTKCLERMAKILTRCSMDRFSFPFTVAFQPDSIHFDPDNQDLVNKFRSYFDAFTTGNRKNNLGDIHRFYSLVFNLEQLKKDQIPGDFAELGVYKGDTSAVLASYANEMSRRLFLLDTFTGLAFNDTQAVPQGEGTFSDTSLASVKQHVGHDDICTYIEGYFPGSITEDLASRRFCFVSLDADFYDPIKAGLEFFYPRLEPGGYIFVHDYSSPYWGRECLKAVDEFSARECVALFCCLTKAGQRL